MGAPDLQHVLPAFQSNLQTTVNLLVSLAEVGCARMITTGSLVEPEEGLRTIPNSPYAAAKWAASDYARMFHALYGFPVAIARVFMVYGPGQLDETKLVPYVIRCLRRQGSRDYERQASDRLDLRRRRCLRLHEARNRDRRRRQVRGPGIWLRDNDYRPCGQDMRPHGQ